MVAIPYTLLTNLYRKLFGEQSSRCILTFLQHPTLLARNNNKASKAILIRIKRRALVDFKLEGSNSIIYHMPERASGRKFGLCFAPIIENAFHIIANIHCQFYHAGIAKISSHARRNYYRICESNVKWIFKPYVICNYNAPSTTKAIIQPIVSERYMGRLQIDLMDFRSTKDGNYS